MGITEDYREEVEELEASIEQRLMPRSKAFRAKNILDSLLPVALILLAFVVFIGLGVPVNSSLKQFISYLNWAVILYFAARLVVGFRLAKSNKAFFRQHWLDFALVVPAFTLLKEVKLFRLLTEAEVFSVEGDAVAGLMFASRNAGVFAKVARIVRVVKKSI